MQVDLEAEAEAAKAEELQNVWAEPDFYFSRSWNISEPSWV